ncbi:MAG: hypothetical protein RL681_430 [Candidatus Parcubacteria bacterium]|jgi:hypothetical protein
MTMKNTIALILLVIVAAIAIMHYLALWNDWYGTIWWIDIPLHLLGGAFVGILFLYIFLARRNIVGNADAIFLIVLGMGFVALVGVLWEFYEFWADVWFFHKYSMNEFPGWIHADTLKDLLNDIIGGTFALATFRALTRSRNDR